MFFSQATNLSHVIEDNIKGAGKAPNSPVHNSTALITANGDFYGATVVDIRGRDPAIYRSMGTSVKLRTVQYDSKWLNGKYMFMDSLFMNVHRNLTK